MSTTDPIELIRQETRPRRRTTEDARRIVIAHGEALVSQSLATHLERDGEIDVVAILDDPERLAATVADEDADGVVVALGDPRFREEARRLRQQHGHVAVIGLVPEAALDGAAGALAHGVNAIVPTTASPRRIRSAVAAATDGWIVMPPAEYREALARVGTARMRLSDLDDEALTLLEAIVDGYTISEIADQTFVSARTVKRRLASLFDRLDCDGRTEAVELYGAAALGPRRTEEAPTD